MSGVVKPSNIRTVLQEIIKPLPKEICVATSGGIDSSSVVMSALDVGKKVSIYSFSFWNKFSSDFRAAQKLSNEFDLRFVPVFLPTAMIHYSKDDQKFTKFRQDYFSNLESAGTKRLIKLCELNKIQLCNPYFEPSVFSLWIDKNWEELNKPRQKEVIRMHYPELDCLKIKPHTNLQLGDSKIAETVGNAVISKYKPNSKSPIGIYNRIAKGVYA
jgi:hypothetical protein